MKISIMLGLTLIISSWTYIFTAEGAHLSLIFSSTTGQQLKEFITQLIGSGAPDNAFLSAESRQQAIFLSFQTLKMSIMAIGLAAVGMLLTVVPAAHNVADGTLSLSRSVYGRVMFFIIRASYIFSRAIPELIWAMLIIFLFRPGIIPGAIALAIHNFGILGKLCAEVIEDLDERPIRSLRNSGAGSAQVLFYGILPTVAPKFITYLLYRWEVIIRTSIIVGFVGAGGLGRQFRLSMSWFHYTEVALLLTCYAVLVLFVDLLAGFLRKVVQEA
ncbi:ABC transporter permease subunit [Metallumcola ferriviriculae]|uniref:ABC transporter permease subunit n=1 Tax=Metallumcola ferriviriculae TaxID=3039180 RepID=A0AAU0UMJ3_9FIRM|nr:ABC transporter permease subunit [Desulfitibacteraceae bacterium MK1]